MARRTPRRKLGDADKITKIGAANLVLEEIEAQLGEYRANGMTWPRSGFTVMPRTTLTCLMAEKAEVWRRIEVPKGTELTWNGDIRVGNSGKLLFGFTPNDDYLTSRKVTKIEVAHTDLSVVFGVYDHDAALNSFTDDLTDMMGATITELIEQALQTVSQEDVAGATAIADKTEPEVGADVMEIEDFGLYS